MIQCDLCHGTGTWTSKEGVEIICECNFDHAHHAGVCLSWEDAKRISEDGP